MIGEAEIKAAGADKAPRVTSSDLDENMEHVEYVTHASHGGQVLRWAVITTKSGYAVVGRPSVSVSPENDNEKIGQKVALENSINELWPLMGYALKEKLHTMKASIAEGGYTELDIHTHQVHEQGGMSFTFYDGKTVRVSGLDIRESKLTPRQIAVRIANAKPNEWVTL